jgi:hypothetical protein
MMSISQWLNDLAQYISGAMARIFGPTDDEYPNIGVQPFEGEPYVENSEL